MSDASTAMPETSAAAPQRLRKDGKPWGKTGGNMTRRSTPAPARDMITREDAARMAQQAAEAAVVRVMAAMQPPNFPPGGGAGTSAAPAPNDMLAFIQQLAKSIAEVGNQGTGKVVVDPAVMQRREDAKVKMMALIAQAWQDRSAPEYELVGTVHLNGPNGPQLIEPMYRDAMRQEQRRKIKWYGPPNKQMRPVQGNAVAEAIYAEFSTWVGHVPGITSTLRTVDPMGRMLTPGGRVFEGVDAIPKAFMGEMLEIDPASMPAKDLPHHTGLEISGPASAQPGKTIEVPILGSIIAPARQQVA